MDRKFRIAAAVIVFLFFSSVIYGVFNKVKRTKEKFIKNTSISISPTVGLPSPTPDLSPPISPTAVNTVTPVFTGRIILAKPGGPTIQDALNSAEPGDVIELEPGTYLQDVVTVRNGSASKPITIKGPKDAVVKGGGNGRIIEINHSYITLEGFTVDGLSGSPSEKSGYADKPIYMIGKSPGQGPSFNKIINMDIRNGGGECVRLRYFARGNEIAGNRITNCGVHDYRFDDGGKNGEGVYIGTAPEQTGDNKNPTSEPDQSNGNWIHDNYFDTQGNECVDVKEGSTGNIVEYNTCTGQKDENSGGFDSRGNENVFRYNNIYGNRGAGVRLGGDKESDGVNNHVYENTIKDNVGGAIKFQRIPQGKVCGNTMENNGDESYTGSHGEDFDPGASC